MLSERRTGKGETDDGSKFEVRSFLNLKFSTQHFLTRPAAHAAENCSETRSPWAFDVNPFRFIFSMSVVRFT